MLVHEDIYEKFIALVVERTKKIKIGHPLVRFVTAFKKRLNNLYVYVCMYVFIEHRRFHLCCINTISVCMYVCMYVYTNDVQLLHSIYFI